MNKAWVYKEVKKDKEVTNLMQQLSIPKSIAQLMIQRGISDYNDAKDFFNPSWKEIHDPYLMKGMAEAIARIEQAMAEDEKIMIYGDYDVDGTTAVSLVYEFFKGYHDLIEYYIPDRYNEGYGISYQGIDYAKENDFTLIIALDCGIKAVEKVDYANTHNVDFIICDHHTPGNKIPNAVAVLDPKQTDCNYPYKELCGCGIGFKLVQAFAMKNDLDPAELEPMLDLVAIAIAADIVPMTGENRALTHYGLNRINTNPRTGLRPYLEASKKSSFNVSDLVFTLAPRINAAGRIHSGNTAVKLLISDDSENAKSVAKDIENFNAQRKDLDRDITAEALAKIENSKELIDRKSTVLWDSSWHKGVVGIVASRLTETYYRPTVILTEKDGKMGGSVRSVKGFDVYNALLECTDEMTQFGGHKYAAGLTLEATQFDGFSKKFEEVVSRTITKDQLTPKIEVDLEINFDELLPDTHGNPLPKIYRLLKRFSPFGPENMQPTFITHNVIDTGKSALIGQDKTHLRLNIFQDIFPDISVGAVGFSLSDHYGDIKDQKPFSIVYTIEVNEWRNQVNLQLNIKDIKFNI